MMTDSMSSPSGLRTMFDRKPGRHRPHTIRNGATFVIAVATFVWILYTKPSLPFLSGGGTTVTAEFAYGANVRPGYTPVRVRGVEVGQVTKIERGSSGRGARVAMQIDDGAGVDLHSDARVDLRWRTLLGRNVYLDLDPGSPSAPRLAGAFIPRSRTSDQVELDTALEPLDDNGRVAVKTIISQFDAGFARPDAVGQTIDGVKPAMRPLARGLKALRGTQVGDLTRLVSSTSRAMGRLSGNEIALGGLVDNGRVALGVTAARAAGMVQTLREAPGALAQTRATMRRLNLTLATVDPLAAALRPGTRALAPAAIETERTLHIAVPLLADLRPTLRDLRPSVMKLGEAAKVGAPVMQPLRNTVDRAVDSFVPFLQQRDSETKLRNYEAIGPAVASASSALANGDRNGPVANFEAGVGEETPVDSPCATKITDPTAGPTEKVSCELLVRMLAGIFTGRQPEAVKVTNSAVSLKQLKRAIEPGGLLARIWRKP